MKYIKGHYENSRSSLARFLSQVSGNDMELVLEDLMTPQEITEFMERIDLLRELKQGKTQRSIAKDLSLSVTTVNRGSRILQYGTGTISRYL